MAKRFDAVCIGTALVDSIIKGFDPNPISASGYRAASGSLNVGGEAVNVSIAAAKLGLSVGILCGLGTDAAGDMVLAALNNSGVDTSLAVRSAEHPTPVTTMFVRDDGSRRSITNGAHRYNFRPDRYLDRIAGAGAILLGSLFRAPFDDPAIVSDVLRFAKAQGSLIIADTKLPNFVPLTLADLKDSLPLIDVITPNEDEARFFSGRTEPKEMAEAFLDAGVKSVIVKLGAKGCLYADANGMTRLPALPIKAVDATGAGDNFVAGYAAKLLWGASPFEALRFANACGAICTTAVGAGTALKDRAQVQALLEAADSGQI